ncbi:MAG: tetratricopeptide repeat protein [Acidobacteria bacterium]|nr:tetratricopeptide repeat protein [Acidobacteriota bacterium]
MDYRIEQLRFQLREDPSSRHFYQLGELLRRQGELNEAVEVLRAGLEHHPEYVAAWVSLGRALFQAERFDESRSAFSRALELDRQNAVAATMLGRAAARVGDWPQAAEALDLAAALVPSDEELASEAEEARSHLEPKTSAGEKTLPEGPAGAEGQVAGGRRSRDGTWGRERTGGGAHRRGFIAGAPGRRSEEPVAGLRL